MCGLYPMGEPLRRLCVQILAPFVVIVVSSSEEVVMIVTVQ